MANFFGECETQEIQEGISYGANNIRDDVNLSTVKREKLLVSPTDIFSLKDLEAYVRLLFNFPLTKVSLQYRKTPMTTTPLIKNQEMGK